MEQERNNIEDIVKKAFHEGEKKGREHAEKNIRNVQLPVINVVRKIFGKKEINADDVLKKKPD